ncbi:MAG: ATP-binding protein [Opitutaceae bacterium]
MNAPESEGWSWRRDVPLTAVLCALAAYADWFAPGVFFGHSLVLGMVFYLVGVRLVGPYAALAVLAAGTVTLTAKWQQPFSALLIALEGLAVAGAWRRRINPLFADLTYWVVLGTPLSWFLYRHVVVIPDPSFSQALVLQPANGLIAVWLSYLVIAQLPAAPGWERPESAGTFRSVLLRRYLTFGTLPVLIGGLLAARTFEQRALSEAQANLDATTRNLAAQVARHIAGGLGLIERLAARQAEENWFTDRARLNAELAAARASSSDFLSFIAADPRGNVVAGTSPTGSLPSNPPDAAFNVADRDYFREPMATARSYVSGVFRGRGFGRDLLIAVSAPVISRSGEPLGVIEGSMTVDSIVALLQRQAENHGMRVLVTDHRLRVISGRGFPHAPLEDLAPLPLGRLISARSAVPSRFKGDSPAGPVTYLSMSLAVPGLDWTLTVHREWRDVIRPVVNAYGWILLVALVTALIASLFATWSVRDLLTGWQALIQFSLAPSGHGALLEDSSQLRHLPLEFRDVMRRLAEMARRLDSETSKREQLLRELESRVQERTRALEEALLSAKSADRAKGAFLATVTHELRTPLTSIITGTRLLRMGWQERNPLVERTLSTLEKSSQVLMSVISDVLDYSKLEAGVIHLEVTRFRPADIVGDVGAILEPAARKANLELRIASGHVPELEWIGDVPRLRQVLLNLAGNAVKFTSGHTVEIASAVELPGDAARLWFHVTDEGPGIPADRQEAIFEPFVQLETNQVMSQAGTGLGLSICRRLVQAMGGELTLESEVGRGSRFSFWIPREPPLNRPPPPATPATQKE